MEIPAGEMAGTARAPEESGSVPLTERTKVKPPSLFAGGAKVDRVTQLTVIAFACFVALLVFAAAFFTDHNGDIDELMMYNPSYMLAHSGKITFPSYSYRAFYNEPVVIHPPIHTAWIGLFERLGLTWYYAEPMPAVLLLLLGIVVVALEPFPPPLKLGLLFSIGFIVSTREVFFVPFGTRPEGEVYAAWFAGLMLLESGRLADWNPPRLFAGAFLITWASGAHYYACAALAGVGVYILWAAWDLKWTNAEAPIAAMIGGGCLFGIPYVILYLRPHLREILNAVQMSKGDAGVITSIRIHLQLYRDWAESNYFPALIRRPAGLGVPLVIFSTILLGAVKPTRGIALAALPLEVFIFLFAPHKLHNYLVHEIAMFVAALATVALMFGDWAWRLIPLAWPRKAFLPAAAASLSVFLIWGIAKADETTIGLVHVHEAEYARAAARQILGPHATVTGRDGGWFTSGAGYWYDIERETLQASHYDAASFFSNFDAAVDYAHQSDTPTGTTISTAYADGSLKLRGFYFGATNEQLQLLLLTAHAVPQVVGYAASLGRMYRFDESSGGDYQVRSAVCPMVAKLEPWNWRSRWPGTFSAVTYLPHPGSGSSTAIATVLMRRGLAEPAGWMDTACKEIIRIDGTLALVDKDQLLDSLRRGDLPMRFPPTLDQVPGYRGVVLPESMRPPAESSRLDGIVNLDQIQPLSDRAKVERLPGIRVSTIPSLGAFSAWIPVHAEGIRRDGPCWLAVRMKVLSGEVGLAAFGALGVVAQTPLPIIRSEQAEVVALRLSSLRDVNQIIVFNASPLVGAEADLLDAKLLVTPNDVGNALDIR